MLVFLDHLLIILSEYRIRSKRFRAFIVVCFWPWSSKGVAYANFISDQLSVVFAEYTGTYIAVLIKECTCQIPLLSYPRVIKSGWAKSTPSRNNSNNQICIIFLLQWFQHRPDKRHKNSFEYFLNIVTLHDVIYVQNKGFFASLGYFWQFISNKIKVLTLFWDESYHNTPIDHIKKKKYNSN